MLRIAALGLLLYAAAFAADLPRPAGQIEFISYSGERVQLAAFKGKVVIVEFLLTHCPGCKNSARILAGVQRDLGTKGLQVVGLAVDPGAGPKIRRFVAETGANFPIGVYRDTVARDYLQIPEFLRMMMPQLAIIDRRGMIREQHGGDDPWMAPAIEEMNVRKAAAKLLAEGAPRGAGRKAAAGKK